MAKAKEIPGLDCGAGASEGVRRVLLARFEEMCEYRGAALEGADIEGVHDMRVASRRLRSALRDFAPRLRRGKRLDAARGALKQLADALGAVRDEDVAIHALGKLNEQAPPEAAAGVEEYAAERRGRRERAREDLAPAIGETAVEQARLLLTRALEGGRGKKKADDGADFAEALRAVVARLWEELEALGASLRRPNKAKRLHDMRIAAKRLRYALELLECCRRDGAAKHLAGEVADLQGELGDLHDCDVWAEDLGGQLARGDSLSAERKRAVVWLLGHFAEKRAGHYRAALTLWHGWEREGFRARLAACLEPPAPEPGQEEAREQEQERPAEEQPAPA
jgi:CHAD domain-containing protein